jgi:O-antigen/teichoic acid export membrane protein
MTDIRKLASQSSHYLLGQFLLMAVGFISFPILTRAFSVGDYGVLGLITTTIAIVTAIAKIGSPSSVVRYYAESKTTGRVNEFLSTVVFGYGALALSFTVLFWCVIQFVPDKFLDRNLRNIMSLASILIFLNCLSAAMTSILRAEQKTKLYNLLTVISRYGSLALSIFFVFFIIKGLYGFYVGQILSGLLVALALLYICLKKEKIGYSFFSREIFRKSMKFGFYLSWSELGHLLLNYADRYLIQLYLGAVSLGLYTAGYNLATYIIEIIKYPINYALDPIYLSIFAKHGEEETKVFLSKALRYFLLFVFPIVFGFIGIGKDLLGFLASSRYLQAYPIIPYVVLGNAIYACQVILNAGLILRNKTHILMNVKILACLLNIGINLYLIPRYNIVGAALATLISYVFYTAVITYYSFKELSFRIDYPQISLYFFVSLVMFMVIMNIDLGSYLLNLLSKVGTGIFIYSSLIILFDREVRVGFFSYAKTINK